MGTSGVDVMTLPTGSSVLWQMCRSLPILDSGSCERLKAVVHGTALGLSALMGTYNAAAWLRRRQSHLAINAVIYLSAVIWERRHVTHHMAALCLTEAAVAADQNAVQADPGTADGRHAA
jgi:hypothetical protein